jgi:hypothetical protein
MDTRRPFGFRASNLASGTMYSPCTKAEAKPIATRTLKHTRILHSLDTHSLLTPSFASNVVRDVRDEVPAVITSSTSPPSPLVIAERLVHALCSVDGDGRRVELSVILIPIDLE